MLAASWGYCFSVLLHQVAFPFSQHFLTEWINRTLKEEHIVVKSLEEDLFDGLVLHHLLENLGSLKLDVDRIALTERKQRQKLSVILEAVAKCLQLEESQLKWSVESILAKDLLSTLHLLVAIAKHFEPTLALPPNVQVETITIEVFVISVFITVDPGVLPQGLESEKCVCNYDAFDELFSCAPDKLDAVKKVNYFFSGHQNLLDGVILLLLIGQLEGYFLNLQNFFLTPASTMEMPSNCVFCILLSLLLLCVKSHAHSVCRDGSGAVPTQAVKISQNRSLSSSKLASHGRQAPVTCTCLAWPCFCSLLVRSRALCAGEWVCSLLAACPASRIGRG
uniref:Parvin gamma n=1 Tax=Catharus ustulatus TaxID=91951 RepID=A0A8C3TVN7_CATUS